MTETRYTLDNPCAHNLASIPPWHEVIVTTEWADQDVTWFTDDAGDPCYIAHRWRDQGALTFKPGDVCRFVRQPDWTTTVFAVR